MPNNLDQKSVLPDSTPGKVAATPAEGVVLATKETQESLRAVDIAPAENVAKKANEQGGAARSARPVITKANYTPALLDTWTPEQIRAEIEQKVASRVQELRNDEAKYGSRRGFNAFRLNQTIAKLRKLFFLVKQLYKMTVDKLKVLFEKVVVNEEAPENIKL